MKIINKLQKIFNLFIKAGVFVYINLIEWIKVSLTDEKKKMRHKNICTSYFFSFLIRLIYLQGFSEIKNEKKFPAQP